MSGKDFDFNKMLHSVRSTINPEYAIPKEKEGHPLNFRMLRIKSILTNIQKKQSDINEDITKLSTHWGAMLEVLQPYLDEETKVSEEEQDAAKQEDAKSEDAAKKEGDAEKKD